VALVLLASTALRGAVVSTWHAPAGDGLQYYALSQELRAHGRFAFAPPPAPPSFTRLPGYPLFLALVAVREAPLSVEAHLRRATRANVLLDGGTAILVYALLRRRNGLAAAAGLAAAVTAPLLLLLGCYGLTESLATFLAALELFLAVRILEGGSWAAPALAGIVAGAAQLVRADAVTMLPSVVLAIVWSRAALRRRVIDLATCAVCAAFVFAPWPLRNLRTFGRPYFGGTVWRTLGGRALPASPIRWARTWASGAPGESYLELVFTIPLPADVTRPGILLPQMYNDAAERQRVSALFARFTSEGWSPAVVDEFASLAHERTHRHPFLTFVELPLRRVLHLWAPVPAWELPMDVPWLRLPERRWTFAWWYGAFYVLAAVGAVALWRHAPGGFERRVLGLAVVAVGARTALYGYAVPMAVTSRYLTEAFAPLAMLAGWGTAALLRARLRPRPWAQGTSPQEGAA
jgi:hypothetical protein